MAPFHSVNLTISSGPEELDHRFGLYEVLKAPSYSGEKKQIDPQQDGFLWFSKVR